MAWSTKHHHVQRLNVNNSNSGGGGGLGVDSKDEMMIELDNDETTLQESPTNHHQQHQSQAGVLYRENLVVLDHENHLWHVVVKGLHVKDGCEVQTQWTGTSGPMSAMAWKEDLLVFGDSDVENVELLQVVRFGRNSKCPILSPTGRFHRTGVASRRGVGLESAQIDLLVQIASGCDRYASGGFEPARKWRASFADHRRLRPNLRRRLFDVGVEQRAPNCRPTVLSDALVDQFDQVGQIYTAGTGRVRPAATVGRNDRRTSGQEFDRRIRTFASGGTVALSGRPAVVWPGLFESGWPVPASCPTVGRTVGSEFLDRRPRRARTVVERDGPTAELSRLFVPVGPVQTSRMGYVEQQFELGRRWSAPDAQPRRHAGVARSVGRGGGIAAGRNRRSHPRRHPLRKRSPSLPAGR
ncbi:hypothetical protein Tsp_01184 [Trichinella spiralis]|uniref:hypothetical protein n=1 Tax=Trichinella spiralis TaxID=6334 RepID=UPI0001EFC669|nr:hypothetical protein Tsp_01184 [Trichinella spiralis]